MMTRRSFLRAVPPAVATMSTAAAVAAAGAVKSLDALIAEHQAAIVGVETADKAYCAVYYRVDLKLHAPGAARREAYAESGLAELETALNAACDRQWVAFWGVIDYRPADMAEASAKMAYLVEFASISSDNAEIVEEYAIRIMVSMVEDPPVNLLAAVEAARARA
ncbi:hypothetical protein [Mesorhizobium sp. L-8-3]|uniref:hypothetical protein n=1 Tax=Mesorhizobium sp. L-8-3 TaxID=2744522 RepID=UPI0019252149|nr:hypothetical protein [Mesorhizobium sp. L-8-3]BCH22100.1 hypothetical protein MesoLjLb_18850 [Mesorhizobium sp. L-8-3]